MQYGKIFYMVIELTKKIEDSLKEYCSLNNIEDIEKFSIDCLIQGFNILKYGTSPLDNIRRSKSVYTSDNLKQEEIIITGINDKSTSKDIEIEEVKEDIIKKDNKVTEPVIEDKPKRKTTRIKITKK